MKWFKHMSNANTDDKLVRTRSEFGMWGVGCYWTILEMIASQMKVNTRIPIATFSSFVLCSLFGCKQNKLETFLKHLQNVYGMNYKRNGNIYEIESRKLLEIKDNYTKDLEETSQPLPSIDIEVDKEVEGEEDIYTPVLNQWNVFAKENGLSTILKLSKVRQSGITNRLKEKEFDLIRIFEEIKQSKFLLGNTGWKVDFDFVFCSANNYLKILEGKYRNDRTPRKSEQISRATFEHGDKERQDIIDFEKSLRDGSRKRHFGT